MLPIVTWESQKLSRKKKVDMSCITSTKLFCKLYILVVNLFVIYDAEHRRGGGGNLRLWAFSDRWKHWENNEENNTNFWSFFNCIIWMPWSNLINEMSFSSSEKALIHQIKTLKIDFAPLKSPLKFWCTSSHVTYIMTALPREFTNFAIAHRVIESGDVFVWAQQTINFNDILWGINGQNSYW